MAAVLVRPAAAAATLSVMYRYAPPSTTARGPNRSASAPVMGEGANMPATCRATTAPIMGRASPLPIMRTGATAIVPAMIMLVTPSAAKAAIARLAVSVRRSRAGPEPAVADSA